VAVQAGLDEDRTAKSGALMRQRNLHILHGRQRRVRVQKALQLGQYMAESPEAGRLPNGHVRPE
jgi:hypothetical protein